MAIRCASTAYEPTTHSSSSSPTCSTTKSPRLRRKSTSPGKSAGSLIRILMPPQSVPQCRWTQLAAQAQRRQSPPRGTRSSAQIEAGLVPS